MKSEKTTATLAFTQTAGNSPLLLLHGFLEDHHIWSEFTDSAFGSRRLIMPDLPGHGKSAVRSDIHSMELMAESVIELLDHLEVEKADILGHSMGGYVALAMCELFPQRIGSLVLLNSTPEADSTERRKNRDRALRLIGEDHSSFVRQAIPALFPQGSLNQYRKEIDRLVERALEFPVEGITAAIKGMRDRLSRTEVLGSFHGKKLWIAGEEDNLVSPERAIQLSNATDTPLRMVKGGHMSWAERPLEIQEILHFID